MAGEYNDVPWTGPPAGWENANRGNVQFIVIHTTEGAARAGAARDGSAYDRTRPDGTSTHYFHDSGETVQEVRTEDIAYAALYQGNHRGIQHELCTRSGSANWNDSYHQAMLKRAAKQVARDCKKWGIPATKITAGSMASGVKGICGHGDVTNAFPADGGDHTDPGSHFPWTQFIGYVKANLAPPTDWSDTVTKAEFFAAMDEWYQDRKQPWALARIGDRGWAPITPAAQVAYAAESIYATQNYDADADGVVDSMSLQGRTARLEEDAKEIKDLLGQVLAKLPDA